MIGPGSEAGSNLSGYIDGAFSRYFAFLGLALVAKIVGEHGGVIECDTSARGTTFRILMPAWKPGSNETGGLSPATEN